MDSRFRGNDGNSGQSWKVLLFGRSECLPDKASLRRDALARGLSHA